MADDIAAWVPDEQLRFDANPTGVAECLVNTDRRIVSWGIGHVDDPNAISKTLVRQIQPKCMPLEIALKADEGSVFAKNGNGQGGFIRRDPIEESPGASRTLKYSVYSITAKHNLRRVTDTHHQVHRPYMVHFRVPGGIIEVVSPDLDWVPTAAHAYDLRAGLDARPAITYFGVDISVGELITDPTNPVTSESSSFAKVRSNFQLKKGQKVGMAVVFPKHAKPTKKTIAGAFENEVDMDETEIKRIYGEHGQVNIYTGEILYVGKDHIEYDINSFTGCSGAIVFLTDVSQPNSVDSCDVGKAVAIHSGSHPFVGDRNFGFIISRHPTMDY
jgi:hypothetical protein